MLLLLRRIVSLTLGLVPLFLIWAGLRSLLFPNPPPDPTLYSVRGQNLQPINPLLFFGGGVVGLFGCYRMCRADGGWKWVLVLMAFFVYALILPVMQNGIHGPPGQGASFGTSRQLRYLAHTATRLAREQGKFTCDAATELTQPSLFVQEGQTLSYVIQCVSDATGPVAGTPPERPGTLVFAVSPDRKRAWFTATVLARTPDSHATWIKDNGGRFFIEVQL